MDCSFFVFSTEVCFCDMIVMKEVGDSMNELFGVSFTICSFLFFVFLLVVYLRKNAKYNLRNRIYRRILCFGFFGFLFEFLFFLAITLSNSEVLISITKKFTFLCFIACMLLWAYYVLILVFEKNKDASGWIRKNSLNLDIYLLVGLVALGIIELSLPVNFAYTDEGDIWYMYGAASLFLYVLSFVLCLVPIPFFVMNRNLITFKRTVSYYFVTFMVILSLVLVYFIPNACLLGFVYTISCYFVYYRLENPDIIFVRRFKRNSERMRYLREQFGFLFNMSPELRSLLNEMALMKDNYLVDGRKTVSKKKLDTLISDFIKSSEDGKTHQTKVDDDGVEILDFEETTPDEMLLTKEIYSLNELKEVLKEDNLPKW